MALAVGFRLNLKSGRYLKRSINGGFRHTLPASTLLALLSSSLAPFTARKDQKRISLLLNIPITAHLQCLPLRINHVPPIRICSHLGNRQGCTSYHIRLSSVPLLYKLYNYGLPLVTELLLVVLEQQLRGHGLQNLFEHLGFFRRVLLK